MSVARGHTALLEHSSLIGVLVRRQAKKCLLSNTSLIFMKGHRKIKKNPKTHFYKTSCKRALFKSILSSSFHGFSSTWCITFCMILLWQTLIMIPKLQCYDLINNYLFICHFNPGNIFVHKLSSAIAWWCEKKQGTFFIHSYYTPFQEKKAECAYCSIPMESAPGYSENSGRGMAVCPPVAFF